MKKFTYVLTIICLLALLASPIAVLASSIENAEFYGIITVSNNSTASENVATTASINTTVLQDGNYLNATANNTVIRNTSGADVSFMPGYTPGGYPWAMWVPSIGADTYLSYILYTANSTGGDINYFPDSGGMTVGSDNASMEVGDNFSLEIAGWIDTSLSANETLIYKQDAFTTYMSAAGEITSDILTTDNITPTSDNDPAVAWNNEDRIWDDNVATYGTSVTAGAGTYTAYIELLHDALMCDGLQYYVHVDNDNSITIIDCDAWYDSGGGAAWHDIYEGTFTEGTWQARAFPDGRQSVTRLRFRLKNTVGGATNAALAEVDFNSTVQVRTTASNIPSDEMTVTTSMQQDPYTAAYDDSVNIGVSMGSGILPVRVLERQELSVPVASVTFSNIDTLVADWDAKAGVTSRHLVVMVNAKSPDAVAKRAVEIQFNGDAGANYWHNTMTGENAVTDGDQEVGVNYLFEYPGGTDYPFAIPGATYANAFGGGTLLIPHAFNAIDNKTVIGLGGVVEDYVSTVAGLWGSTDAITSMVLTLDTGNFDTGSTILLGVVDERYLVEEDTNATADFLPVFDTIPGDGHDLVMIGYLRADLAADVVDTKHEINNDNAAANYFRQRLFARGGALTSVQENSNWLLYSPANLSTADVFAGLLINYSQYAEATNHVHYAALSGYYSVAGNRVYTEVLSGRWANVAAITKLEYFPAAGVNFEAGSLFSLYRVPRYTIDRQELAAPAATITFDNIPDTYEVLQLNIYARSDVAALSEDVEITLNADAVAANYDFQELTSTGAVVAAARNAASQVIMAIPAANEGANEFGGGAITIPIYTRTDGHKHLITLSGTQENQVIIRSSRWEDSSAITRIDLDLAGANNFVAGSVFELVGVIPTQSFMIEVDGDVEGIEAANAYSVVDNGQDWIVGGDATPYIDYYHHTVNGTLTANITWEYGPIFYDETAYGNDATPTFRTASSDPDISANMTSFLPIAEAKAPDYTLAPTSPFISSTPNITGNFTIVPPIGGFPLAGVFVAIAGATTPPQMPLMIISCFLILVVSLSMSYVFRKYGSGSLIAKSVAIVAVMGVLIAIGNMGFDFWMLVVFAVMATAFTMASKQLGWS